MAMAGDVGAELLLARIALRESEARLRTILDSATEYIGLLDLEGRVVQAGRSALQLCAVELGDVLGKLFWDTPWWRHSPELQQRLRLAIERAAQGQADRFDATHPRSDGALVEVDFTLNPVLDDKGRVVALLPEGRDITARLASLRALEAARREAERASHAKSRLISIVSHDLRQPLQTVGLLAGVLERSTQDETLLDVVRQQQQALASANDLLAALLDIGRLESGAIRPQVDWVQVRDLALRLQSELAPKVAEKHLHFAVDVPDHCVRTDRLWLRQILQNLLGNALRFTPEHGEVRLSARVAGDALRIEVADTGEGIPAAQLGRIFDEFYQVERPATGGKRGWGLGLSIVRHAAQMLGIGVDVRSEPGQGTTFVLNVPGPVRVQTADAKDRSGSARAVSAPAPAKRRQVLVIDDDEAVGKATALLLRSAGYRVAVASNGQNVRSLLADKSCEPVVIVSDLHLGQGESGPELVREVRERLGYAVPVIFVTGDTCGTSLAQFGIEGSRLLSKPLDPESLLHELAQSVAA